LRKRKDEAHRQRDKINMRPNKEKRTESGGNGKCRRAEETEVK
jgi:hypothetical protein